MLITFRSYAQSLYLYVYSVPPNLDESQWKQKLTVIQNTSITINCPVTGIPDPDINWLANGQLLQPDSEFRDMKLSENGRAVSGSFIFLVVFLLREILRLEFRG